MSSRPRVRGRCSCILITVPNSCHVCVTFPSHTSPIPCNDGSISSLLGCPILSLSRVGTSTLKVKIHKECLHRALSSGNIASHFVKIWRHKPVKQRRVTCPTSPTTCVAESISLSLVTWNCRGLHNSIPYMKELISRGADILVIQEHWLWPFQLSNLHEVHPEYSYMAMSDQRLSSDSNKGRGCGGVAIMWRKSFITTPLSDINSVLFSCRCPPLPC